MIKSMCCDISEMLWKGARFHRWKVLHEPGRERKKHQETCNSHHHSPVVISFDQNSSLWFSLIYVYVFCIVSSCYHQAVSSWFYARPLRVVVAHWLRWAMLPWPSGASEKRRCRRKMWQENPQKLNGEKRMVSMGKKKQWFPDLGFSRLNLTKPIHWSI